jgi:hypothetical protein
MLYLEDEITGKKQACARATTYGPLGKDGREQLGDPVVLKYDPLSTLIAPDILFLVCQLFQLQKSAKRRFLCPQSEKPPK